MRPLASSPLSKVPWIRSRPECKPSRSGHSSSVRIQRFIPCPRNPGPSNFEVASKDGLCQTTRLVCGLPQFIWGGWLDNGCFGCSAQSICPRLYRSVRSGRNGDCRYIAGPTLLPISIASDHQKPDINPIACSHNKWDYYGQDPKLDRPGYVLRCRRRRRPGPLHRLVDSTTRCGFSECSGRVDRIAGSHCSGGSRGNLFLEKEYGHITQAKRAPSAKPSVDTRPFPRPWAGPLTLSQIRRGGSPVEGSSGMGGPALLIRPVPSLPPTSLTSPHTPPPW